VVAHRFPRSHCLTGREAAGQASQTWSQLQLKGIAAMSICSGALSDSQRALPRFRVLASGLKCRNARAYTCTRFNRNALPMTDTELKLMAAAAMIGLRSKPNDG
jgi:hypothetical protein